MELVELIIGGTGAIHALLLLLLDVDKESMKNQLLQMRIDEYMFRLKGELKNEAEVREMVSWILNDKFKEETQKREKGGRLLRTLQILKDQMINFYFKHLDQITQENPDLNKACDVHTTIGKLVIQLMRLRMVVQPDIQYSINIHPVTEHEYLTVKVFWIGDDGKKVRKFTKSLGRMEDHPTGIDSKEVKEFSVKRVQEFLYQKYVETYPG